jgi:hypothetical protein
MVRNWVPFQEEEEEFDPDSIAGLQGWWKADSLSLSDGDPVTSWTDSSGNGKTMATGVAPSYQTNELNGLPIVRFDGTDDRLNTASGGDVRHLFVVMKVNESTFGNFDGVFTGTTTPAHLIGEGGTTNFFAANAIRLNGVASGTNEAPMNVWAYVTQLKTSGFADYQIGRDREAVGRELSADIAEVLAYEFALADADRDAVEAYLANKWGL